MTLRDFGCLCTSFWIITATQFALAWLVGASLDEYDHIHALIIAVGLTILEAIREYRNDA